MPEHEKLEELVENLKSYFSNNYKLIKLETAERTSVVGSDLLSGVVICVIALLFVLFISLAAGFYLSKLLGDNISGFLIISGFYFVLTIIFYLGRKKLLQGPLREKIVRKIFGNHKSL
jgi:hypothetical protein